MYPPGQPQNKEVGGRKGPLVTSCLLLYLGIILFQGLASALRIPYVFVLAGVLKVDSVNDLLLPLPLHG